MAEYAAFLRGINLGKSRRVKKEALVGAFEGCGMESAATFRASGNVVFDVSAEQAEGKLRERVEAGLAEALGIDVAVFLRSAREVREIAAQVPFDEKARAASEGKLQVALLQREPTAAVRAEALAMATGEDPIAIRGRELFWLPRARSSESELDLRLLERTVGEWTMRTMGTVEQIAAKYFDGG
jgi:uncharacterized protein (DUF1697 family)